VIAKLLAGGICPTDDGLGVGTHGCSEDVPVLGVTGQPVDQ
jgi:hypothetical protein